MALGARQIAELQLRRALAGSHARSRRLRAVVPEQRWPTAERLAYFVALKQVLKDLHGRLDRLLIPQLPRLLASVAADKPAVLRADAAHLRLDATDSLKSELATISDLADNVIDTPRAKRIATTAGQQVSSFNKNEINKQFKSSVGIELLRGEPYLQQQLDLFAEDNARLITSLAADHLDQVAGIVMRAARAGTPVAYVKAQIEARFVVSESKAELIARDQVGKLNGELTQLRHTSVGVTEYEWSTSRDERVRTRHAELEGSSHSWDDPPVVDDKTGRRAHPGQDFQCRCTAIPKVDDLLDALGELQPDAAGAGGAPPPPPAAPPPAPPAPAPLPRSVFLGPAEPRTPLDAGEVRAALSALETVPRDAVLLERHTDRMEQLGRSGSLDLSNREKEAIECFGGHSYRDLAAVELRQFDDVVQAQLPELQRHVDNLYVAIGEAEQLAAERGDEPITLYRGMGSSGVKLVSDHLVNDELSIQRLSSWSTDPMVAYDFAGRGGDQRVILEVKSRKGLPIAAYAPVLGESETILGKNRYRVVERRSMLDFKGRHTALYLVVEEIE